METSQTDFKQFLTVVNLAAISQHVATNLCVDGSKATTRHPFALKVSVKVKIALI